MTGRVWAEGGAVGGYANVPRPLGSSFIWQNPKSTLRHPPHHHLQAAVLAGKGWIPVN